MHLPPLQAAGYSNLTNVEGGFQGALLHQLVATMAGTGRAALNYLATLWAADGFCWG